MKIRQEQEKDYKEVYELIQKAFAEAEHSDGQEQDLVEALRKGEHFIPTLSLVAEEDGKMLGHILFTKINIGDEKELALAPLAVLPEYQKRGIGSALIEEGHRIAKSLGYHYSVVLGSENYYPKMGYIPAVKYGIVAPFDVPTENFMACKLCEEEVNICGVVQYAPEFGIAE